MYKIVSSYYIKTLEKKVNKLSKKGYKPVGTFRIWKEQIHQVMIKEKNAG